MGRHNMDGMAAKLAGGSSGSTGAAPLPMSLAAPDGTLHTHKLLSENPGLRGCRPSGDPRPAWPVRWRSVPRRDRRGEDGTTVATMPCWSARVTGRFLWSPKGFVISSALPIRRGHACSTARSRFPRCCMSASRRWRSVSMQGRCSDAARSRRLRPRLQAAFDDGSVRSPWC